MKKRWLALVLSLCLTMGSLFFLPGDTTAFATEKHVLLEEESSEQKELAAADYKYQEQEDGTLKITGYLGSDTEIEIPSAIDGKKVTCLEDGAFSYQDKLIRVTIPSGVNEIGSQTFSCCSSLTEVIIPEGVKTIGYAVFRECGSLNKVQIPEGVTSIGNCAFEGCTALENMVLPDGIVAIGGSAFGGCSSLESISLPEGILEISEQLFRECSSLKSITIPNSVTSIGNYAFWKCSSLSEITIPKNVGNMGEGIFEDCGSLENINVAAENEGYTSQDGVLYTAGMKELIRLPMGKEIGNFEVPSGVETICDRAFNGCDSLTGIHIPATVTEIGDTVFEFCLFLQKIDVADENPNYASEDGILYTADKKELIRVPSAKGNTDFTVLSGVVKIGRCAFLNCAMEKITISDSVEEIGKEALMGGSLKEIYVVEENKKYASLDGVLYNKNMTEIILFPSKKETTEFSVPLGVERIGDSVFHGCANLVSISLPDSVSAIGTAAFNGCTGLKEISIPSKVKIIGDSAFMSCSSLKSISLSEGLEMIEGSAFYRCASLTSILLPESVTSIGGWAFRDCSNLKEVKMGDKVTKIDAYAFYNCSSMESINIPGSVTEIGECAFGGCSGLKSTTIGEGTTSIGGSVFSGCTSLTDTTIPETVTEIGEDAYKACEALSDVYYSGNENQWNEIEIQSGNETLRKAKIHYNWNKVSSCVHGNTVLRNVKEADCIENGYTGDCVCTICGAVVQQGEVIPAKGHNYETVTYQAAPETNGSIIKKCTVCGDERILSAIERPEKIVLSKASYTYNGKVHKPAVEVRDSAGKVLEPGTSYSVTYAKGRKNVGVYEVKVELKGNYTGIMRTTFSIVPKNIGSFKVSAKSKAMLVSWKKQTNQSTGYQVQYSTDKKFKKAVKTVTVKKNKTTSVTVKKLKAKKTYFVRVRTYKTVKANGKSVKVYSDWTKAKKVVIKK